MESLEQYLEQVGRQRESRFGKRFRAQFRDVRGTSELAMLAAPDEKEYEDFCCAVSVMSRQEKSHPEMLGDQQIQAIADRAGADAGNVAIFLNGYVLEKSKAK